MLWNDCHNFVEVNLQLAMIIVSFFLIKILTASHKCLGTAVGRQWITSCSQLAAWLCQRFQGMRPTWWATLKATQWATGLIDAHMLPSPKHCTRERNIFLTPTEAHLLSVNHDPCCEEEEEWWWDPASWVSAPTMSSSRPCSLGRSFPGWASTSLDHHRCRLHSSQPPLHH